MTQSSTDSRSNGLDAADTGLDREEATIDHTAAAPGGKEWLLVELSADAVLETVDPVNRERPRWVMDGFNGATLDILDDGKVVWSSSAFDGSAAFSRPL